MNNKSNFSDLLKRTGLKVTKHRNSVLEVLNDSNEPLTAEDIYILLKKKDVSINLSSVYRILDTLVSTSILNKFIFEEKNKTFYEINNYEHKHHLICCSCKRVFPLSNCPLSSYEKEVSTNLEFEITSHKLEIYGYCKDCKSKKETS